MHSSKNHSRGLTLIELVIAIAVVAILLMLGMPSINEVIKNNRVTAQNNELVAMVNFAKNEAIRRNETITLELASDTGGWSGIVRDPDGTGVEPCVADGALRCADNEKVALAGTTLELNFNNRGYLREASEIWQREVLYLQHENCSGPRQRRRIDILPTGQISSCNLACDATTVCPQ